MQNLKMIRSLLFVIRAPPRCHSQCCALPFAFLLVAIRTLSRACNFFMCMMCCRVRGVVLACVGVVVCMCAFMFAGDCMRLRAHEQLCRCGRWVFNAARLWSRKC